MFLLRIDPDDGSLAAQFSIEGFNLGYFRKDIQPRMFASYDEDDLAGFVMFAGSWSNWAK